MWVSPALGMRRAAPVRWRLLALVLLLLLVFVACGPKATNKSPVADDERTGSIAIIVEGLVDVDADITVTGPGMYSQSVTGTTTLAELVPGEYAVVAAEVPGYVVVGESNLTVQVEGGVQASVTVRYTDAPSVSLGSLEIKVVGLTAADADIQVSGPEAFSQDFTGPAVLRNLVPGGYTVTAAQVGEFVVVGDASQTVTVTADAAATVTVRYADAAVVLNSVSSLELPMHQARRVEFTIDRRGAFTGPVDFTVKDLPDLALSPLSGTVAAGVDTFTVMVEDDGAALGDHQLEVSISAEADSRSLADDDTVNVSLVAVVTADEDDNQNPIPGSLRGLLDDERIDGATITFEPSLYEGSGLVIELEDTLAVTRNVHIRGPEWFGSAAEPLVALDGDSAFRVLSVMNATVTLTNLQVQNGAEQHGAGVIVTEGSKLTLEWSQLRENSANLGNLEPQRGGAVWAGGGTTVELMNSRVVNNTAGNRGGGIYVVAGTEAAPSRLVVTNSVVSDNDAHNGGGIFVDHSGYNFGRTFLEISDSEITGNTAAAGAGITSYGEATVENSVIQGNEASDSGGGIRNHLSMIISDSQIIGNSAVNDYGGVFNDGSMTVIGSRIAENTAGGDGAGIFNGWPGSAEFANGEQKQLRIEGSLVEDNVAGNHGGGIHSVRKLMLIDSHVTGNEAAGDGGGIYAVNFAHYSAPVNSGGELDISGTTIDGNHAGVRGGGIYSGTVLHASLPNGTPGAPFTSLNSTISGNTAMWGGGVYLGADNAGAARLYFNTIARNSAIGAGGQGGGMHVNRGNVTIQGNLIVENQNTSGVNSRDLFPGAGQVTSGGNNFISTNPSNVTALQSDRFGGLEVSPGAQLSELMDNGGPTPTMALPNASHARRWVTLAGCVSTDGITPLTVDQRGMVRPVSTDPGGTRCSIGAYQWQGF